MWHTTNSPTTTVSTVSTVSSVSGLGVSTVLSHNINYGLLLKTARAANREGQRWREREKQTNKIKFEMKIKINRKRKKAMEREWQGPYINTFNISIYHMYIVYRVSYIWYMVYRLCRHSSGSCLFACIYLFIAYAYLKSAAHPQTRLSSGHGNGLG